MEVPWIPPPIITIDLGVALVVVVVDDVAVAAADIIVREDDDDDDDEEKAWTMQVVLNAVVINTGRSLGNFISLCSCYYCTYWLPVL